MPWIASFHTRKGRDVRISLFRFGVALSCRVYSNYRDKNGSWSVPDLSALFLPWHRLVFNRYTHLVYSMGIPSFLAALAMDHSTILTACFMVRTHGALVRGFKYWKQRLRTARNRLLCDCLLASRNHGIYIYIYFGFDPEYDGYHVHPCCT